MSVRAVADILGVSRSDQGGVVWSERDQAGVAFTQKAPSPVVERLSTEPGRAR